MGVRDPDGLVPPLARADRGGFSVHDVHRPHDLAVFSPPPQAGRGFLSGLRHGVPPGGHGQAALAGPPARAQLPVSAGDGVLFRAGGGPVPGSGRATAGHRDRSLGWGAWQLSDGDCSGPAVRGGPRGAGPLVEGSGYRRGVEAHRLVSPGGAVRRRRESAESLWAGVAPAPPGVHLSSGAPGGRPRMGAFQFRERRERADPDHGGIGRVRRAAGAAAAECPARSGHWVSGGSGAEIRTRAAGLGPARAASGQRRHHPRAGGGQGRISPGADGNFRRAAPIGPQPARRGAGGPWRLWPCWAGYTSRR